MERGLMSAVLAVAIAGLAGCAGAGTEVAAVVEPGLANAASLPLAVSIDSHDVIANGHDSCPRGRVVAGDPLRFRFPACPGGETVRPDVTLLIRAPAVTDDERNEGELWNVHLRGLPPCEEKSGEEESALAVCRAD
jgi:hypothetical protein